MSTDMGSAEIGRAPVTRAEGDKMSFIAVQEIMDVFAVGNGREFPANARILLAEDNSLIAMDMEQGLIDDGASQVTVVASLEEMIAALENGEYDVAIMETRLSGHAVWTLAAELRQRGTSVVFATGRSLEPIPEPLSDVPVVPKPYSLSQIVALVRAMR